MGKDEFEPYVDNGGTVAAIGGEGFCILAGDTRVSEEYSIMTRNKSKLHEVTKGVFTAASGMCADIDELWKHLDYVAKDYYYTACHHLDVAGVATYLHTELYSRRFFPYYAFCLACGIDKDGKGGIYTYDAVGNMERRPYSSQGSGSDLLVPLLDRALRDRKTPISEADALELCLSAFKAAVERDIHTGDTLEIVIIRPEGVERLTRPLRKD